MVTGKRRPSMLNDMIYSDHERGVWKEELINDIFRDCVAQEILKIKLPARRMEDVIAWHFEKSGRFTMRSAYRLGVSL